MPGKGHWRIIQIIAASFLVGLLTLQAAHSEEKGVVRGVVVDPSGAVIPNAVVRLESEHAKAARTAFTEANGSFQFEGLTGGTYTVVAESPGFLPTSKPLRLKASHTLRLTISLRLRPFKKVVSGCNEKAELPRDFWRLRPISIKLEKKGCFGGCPIYTITLSHDGSMRYKGEMFVDVVGMVPDQIDPSVVEKLLRKLQKLGFFRLCNDYQTLAVDLEEVVISVSVGTMQKSVRNYGSAAPAEFDALEREINKTAKVSRFLGKFGRN